MARDKDSPKSSRKPGGFKVGPRLAKGAYRGHTQKIKQTLIHKAQVKKSYYKELKKNGYGGSASAGTSTAFGPSGSNEVEVGERRVKGSKKGKGKAMNEQRRGPVPSDDEEGGEGEDGEGLEETKKDSSDDDDDDEDDTSSKPRPRKRQRPTTQPTPRSQPPPRPPKLTDAEVDKLRTKRSEERREWGKRGRTGQPKLGGRVEMLLGRIRKGLE